MLTIVSVSFPQNLSENFIDVTIKVPQWTKGIHYIFQFRSRHNRRHTYSFIIILSFLFIWIPNHDCPFKDLNQGKRSYFTKNPQVQGGAQSVGHYAACNEVHISAPQVPWSQQPTQHCSLTQLYKYTDVLQCLTKNPNTMIKKKQWYTNYKHTYDKVHISAPQVPWSQQPALLFHTIVQIHCCFAILHKNPKYNDKKEVMIYKHTYDDVLIYQLRKCRGHNNQHSNAVLQYKKKQYRYKHNTLIHICISSASAAALTLW